jgi:RNA polymerase sigma factor (sigma-70 family)
LNLNQFLEQEYPRLQEAAKKITGNHELQMDLLHYAIEELAGKRNLDSILASGGGRFYLVSIMLTQWRSQTGPFYKQFIKEGRDIDHYEQSDEQEEPLDVKRINKLLDTLPWYDRELFKLYVDGDHTYSSLSRETKIPRTSISLTIKRVRNYIKKNL